MTEECAKQIDKSPLRRPVRVVLLLLLPPPLGLLRLLHPLLGRPLRRGGRLSPVMLLPLLLFVLLRLGLGYFRLNLFLGLLLLFLLRPVGRNIRTLIQSDLYEANIAV